MQEVQQGARIDTYEQCQRAQDGEGAKLQRIQVMAWTSILALIFVWNVVSYFNFVDFDKYLLLLMGIANSSYLGFKPFEKPAKS